ncbi:hypothetical protein PQB86_gp195 [Klebsiella phage Miami]|uniref:Uncharacterized protein n=1 Tax=Klebsiella phage Miami TaxID=2767581 RepID=A0A873WD40_9CAUD|nr:hypothetical protein PQB86_gp195 [Klebsiella phage Miami]QPB09290.1 hypothetical protein CPT_Miami_195 [Klebsiella phage Miami]
MIWVKQACSLWYEKRTLKDWGEILTFISMFCLIVTLCASFATSSVLWLTLCAINIVLMISLGPLFDWLHKNKSTIVMRVERERMLKDPFDSMIHAYLETDGADIEELLDVLRMDSFTLHNQIKNTELKSRVSDAIAKMHRKQSSN